MSRRVLVAHLLLTALCLGVAMVLASACVDLDPEPLPPAACVSTHGLRAGGNCEALEDLDAAASALLTEDGLSPDSLRDVTVSVHPDSDGKDWAPNDAEKADGFTSTAGQSFCDWPPLILLANDRWASAAACHELFHIARGCNGNAADHAWMAERHVDERCAVAMSGTPSNLTGSMGGSP